MTVTEQRDVAFYAAHFADQPIDARADLLRRFTAGSTVAEHQPSRIFVADLLRRKALIVTVVPFAKIRVDFGAFAETREVAGFARTLERADEHEFETLLCEQRREPSRDRAPVFGERNVRGAGVLPTQTPLRFTVTK